MASWCRSVSLIPSPPARLACAVILLAGLFAVTDVLSIVLLAAAALLVCLAVPAARRAHLVFMLWIWLPLAIWLMVVWGAIVGAAPGAPLRSDSVGGLLYAVQVSARLEAMAAIIQASFLSIPLEQLGASLLTLRTPKPLVLVVVSVFALGPELTKRAEQVVTARAARGLATHDRGLRAVRGVASTLMPLIAWGFRSAAARAEYWNQRRLLDSPRLNSRLPILPLDIAYVIASVAISLVLAFAHGALAS